MNRLTFHEKDGTFGVAGMNEENQDQKLYMCIVKLKDYEDKGLSPDEVEQLTYKIEDLQAENKRLNDFEHSQCAQLLAENGKLKKELIICPLLSDSEVKQPCIEGPCPALFNEPLTLDQLRRMDGEPVWVKDISMNKIQCLQFDAFKPATYHKGDDARFNQFGTEIGVRWWCCKYGKTWLAYRHKPEEANT